MANATESSFTDATGQPLEGLSPILQRQLEEALATARARLAASELPVSEYDAPSIAADILRQELENLGDESLQGLATSVLWRTGKFELEGRTIREAVLAALFGVLFGPIHDDVYARVPVAPPEQAAPRERQDIDDLFDLSYDEPLRARVLGRALAALGRSPEELLDELEIGRMTFDPEVSPRVAMAVLRSGMMGTSASLEPTDRERASALAVATVLLGERQPAHLYYVDNFEPHESDDTVAPEVVEAWLGIPAGRA